ncbi:MAG: glutathione S-transferase [Lysobacter sp.]|nr:glutathione S-transferase [Lysobacter sp.]
MTSSQDNAQPPYILYGAEVSLYSGKTRAYLRYKNIPFQERLATLDVYREVIVPNIGRRVMPVVRTPEGEYLQDTTAIIDALEPRFPGHPVYPATPAQRLVALLMELYSDEWLVMPAMHYRWQRKRENLRFILGEFGHIMRPGAPGWLKPVFGMLPASMFGGMYQKYFGIGPPMHAAVERSYEGFLDEFNAHLAQHDFLLGSRPSIGDFGLIGPLYAHLYRDPAPGKLMHQRAPLVARWVERMQQPEPGSGDFLPDDEIPATLLPLLARMFREQVPVLQDTVRAVTRWCGEHPEQPHLPRVIGRHGFDLEGASSTRAIQPYSQWMFQRPVFFLQQIDGAGRASVESLLRQVGGLAALTTPIQVPLEFVHHRVRRADPVPVAAGTS